MNKYIEITFKTPDAMEDAINDHFPDRPDSEYQEAEDVKKFLEQYIGYGEVITIRFDIIGKTAVVLHRPTKCSPFKFRDSDHE